MIAALGEENTKPPNPLLISSLNKENKESMDKNSANDNKPEIKKYSTPKSQFKKTNTINIVVSEKKTESAVTIPHLKGKFIFISIIYNIKDSLTSKKIKLSLIDLANKEKKIKSLKNEVKSVEKKNNYVTNKLLSESNVDNKPKNNKKTLDRITLKDIDKNENLNVLAKVDKRNKTLTDNIKKSMNSSMEKERIEKKDYKAIDKTTDKIADKPDKIIVNSSYSSARVNKDNKTKNVLTLSIKVKILIEYNYILLI